MSIESEFELMPLGDLVRFINGDRSSNYPKGNDYVEAGIPFISATDLSNGRIDKSSAKGITDAAYEKLRSGKIQADDVLFCLRGSIGKLAYVHEGDVGAIASSLVIVRATEKVNARYLFFVLSSPSGQQAALGLNNGAAQPNVSVGELQKVRIPLPPMPSQRRIASILSAYDDLIENNTRRIAILEEMARRIYEEWFVHFRYPGHEQVKMVESELGLIPEGWNTCRLDDVLVLQRGFDLPRQSRADGPFPIVSASGEAGTHSEFKVRGPGVVTGRSGSLGTVMYIEGDYWPLNTTLWVKEFRVGSPLYAYNVLGSIDLAGFNSGAAVPTLNRNDVHGLTVLRPDKNTLASFDKIALPMMKLKKRLELKNSNLRSTRDLLLPKLISGELDVSTFAKSVESLAA